MGIAVFLALMLPLTLALREWRTAALRADAAAVQTEAVARAADRVEEQFQAWQEELSEVAEGIAEDPRIQASLRELSEEPAPGAREQIVHYAAGLELPERTAIEIYDAQHQLQGWNGFTMLPDDGIVRPEFMRAVQTAVAHDGEQRQALVLWYPVKLSGRAVGAVRAMRLIGVRTPVQNQYLRSFSLSDTWSRATGLGVQVRLEGGDPEPLPRGLPVRTLRGVDGTVLGRYTIAPPPLDRLLEQVRARFGDVLAFWATLLMAWGFAGVWLWYVGAGRPLVVVRPRQRAAWWRALGRFGIAAAAWWALRFALLALDVPARWQEAPAPLAPLFDPTHFASTIGRGLFRSTGDLLLTALFALASAVTWLELAARFRNPEQGRMYLEGRWRSERGSLLACGAISAAAAAGATCIAWGVAVVARHAVLDSTLDYFVRSGLVPSSPERLLLVVFCALLVLCVAALALVIGGCWIGITMLVDRCPPRWPPRRLAVFFGVAAAGVVALIYAATGIERALPWPVAPAFVVLGVAAALFGRLRRSESLELLSLRGVLFSVFVVSVLLYPMLYQGMEARERMQVMDAAESFTEKRDPSILFALEQVLEGARGGERARRILSLTEGGVATQAEREALDSLAVSMLNGSFLAAMGPYDVSLTILDGEGRPVGRAHEADPAASGVALDQVDSMEFDILRQMYAEAGAGPVMVEQITGRLQRDRFQYAGITPIRADGAPGAWVMARAESQTLVQYRETPFPRVLLPSGFSQSVRENISLAEFRGGVLNRSLGRDFGRYALGDEVMEALTAAPELWRPERTEGRRFLTYYRREEPDAPLAILPGAPPAAGSVLAVRVPAVNAFDHLYYLLRLSVAGLFVGLPVYLIGLVVRRRMGLLPPPRVRFRDKVVNAFLGVGLITVTAVGIVGQQVVQEETQAHERADLREHLEQVEQILALQAREGEMPYRVLGRTRIDSVAAVVGVDLNVYRRAALVATTRPQLVRDRLIDTRLPVGVYESLYLDGDRTAFTREELGSFAYSAGYHALLDESGEPQYVISVPTLPDQERIEEERARTTAYLFGALLLLLLAVMTTAALVADALARPIGKLRGGLEAVAKGQFERKIPVVTRDEVGDLVRTFNEMQEQLAESRRALAQQERQLAWREMARQVAHEIKNPLTPMKLSVQHLRRAFDVLEEGEARKREKFTDLFERITNTLIEQIDALARIANEFHSFARMPTRMVERLDLNAVVQEAVALMQEEAGAEIDLRLHPEPLVVEADREELRRIYINLIKNAIQAIPEEREGKVEVATRLLDGVPGDPGQAESTVTDNGVGVPAELRERIFEPNFSTKTSGAGLGLAITRKGVEEMHGEIGFETEEGAGTTFRLRIPLVEE